MPSTTIVDKMNLLHHILDCSYNWQVQEYLFLFSIRSFLTFLFYINANFVLYNFMYNNWQDQENSAELLTEASWLNQRSPVSPSITDISPILTIPSWRCVPWYKNNFNCIIIQCFSYEKSKTGRQDHAVLSSPVLMIAQVNS